MSLKNDDELQEILNECCPTHKNVNRIKGYVLPVKFDDHFKVAIDEMEVYDDDVWVTSFPKCGTTWVQEMVWCICNELNFEAADFDLDLRFPFLESSSIESEIDHLKNSINFVKDMKRPRFIKTHLPWQLLPKQIQTFEKRPKIIHVARNPMDVCISFYHQSKYCLSFDGELSDFCQVILRDKYIWCPYADNLLSYWTKRNEPNVLFLKFEDMKSDLNAIIDVVYDFFRIDLPPADKRLQLMKHLSFESMKNNKHLKHSDLLNSNRVNNMRIKQSAESFTGEEEEFPFIRKGVTGQYNNEMSPEFIQLFNSLIIDKLSKEGLTFN